VNPAEFCDQVIARLAGITGAETRGSERYHLWFGATKATLQIGEEGALPWWLRTFVVLIEVPYCRVVTKSVRYTEDLSARAAEIATQIQDMVQVAKQAPLQQAAALAKAKELLAGVCEIQDVPECYYFKATVPGTVIEVVAGYDSPNDASTPLTLKARTLPPHVENIAIFGVNPVIKSSPCDVRDCTADTFEHWATRVVDYLSEHQRRYANKQQSQALVDELNSTAIVLGLQFSAVDAPGSVRVQYHQSLSRDAAKAFLKLMADFAARYPDR